MSIIQIIVLVAVMSAFSFGGGISFKQYVLTKDILFFAAGFLSYGASNLCFLLLIEESGITRTIVLGTAVGIVLNTMAGVYFREQLTWVHFTAAALVVSATLLMLAHNPTHSMPDIISNPSETEDTLDV
ncbi:MAG: hypothetical protein ACSHYC_21970 [Alphaproteobacteria bacterium]